MINNKLFLIPEPKHDARLRVFLFPYAGGGISTYLPWISHFCDKIELVIVQPPGRGSRINEAPFKDMPSLVKEITSSASFICSLPFVFFGHSLGARTAYETCVQLLRMNLPLPLHLIASGSKAPHCEERNSNKYNLPRDDFISVLKKLDGTPKEILDNSELLDFLMPTIRADFQISETYKSKKIKMPFPITVLGGTEDLSVTNEQLLKWNELTTKGFNLTKLPGNHFFVNSNLDLVVSEVKVAIDEYSSK